ncbi:MAG: ATP-binding protein [Bacteriovoracaceae bacterium]|nr:ATP-binding protein [Bacteriovoracaceae bacterium]
MDLLNFFFANNIILRECFDALKAGVLITDRNSQIVYANTYSRDILRCDLTGMSPAPWRNNESLKRILNGEDLPEFKMRITIDNTDCCLAIKAIPLKNQEGSVLGAFINFHDITEDYLQEKMMLKKQGFYQRLLDLIPAYIIMKNLDGIYVFSNKFFNEAFSNGPVLGKKTIQLFSSETNRMINENDARVIKQEKVLEFIENLPHKDGTLHICRTIRFPTYDEENNIDGICAIALDETEKIAQQKKAEKERVNNINATKLASLGTLAAEIGHEINNPLGIMKTSVMVLREMIEKNEPVKDQLHQVGIIDQTLDRINNIVKALKFLSRDSTNEEFALCSVGDIIADTEILCRTKLKLKNVKYHFDQGEVDLNETIPCNRVQISQVLLNVFVNAIDAVSEQITPVIKLRLEQDEDFLYFKISDNGQGVPQELRAKIFEPFFTTKKLGMGTGLGLSISKDIMEKHAGDLLLSETEDNNCFIIKLPRKL